MNFILLLALAAAPADLGYGAGTLDLPKLAAVPDATLATQVIACAKGYAVAKIVRRGEATPVWSVATAAGDTLATVNRAERVALLSILGRKLVGSEVDVLVPLPDGKSQPVTVTWELDGVVTFESGAVVGSLTDDTMTVAKIKEQFEVGEFLEGEGKWDPAMLSLLQQALATLSPSERALVKGLHFRRMKTSGMHRAQYERGDTTNWVNVYDASSAFSKEMFTGSAASPRPEALIALIHELGHAIADARFREKGVISKAAADEYKRRLPEVDAAIAAHNARVAELGPKPDAAKLKGLEEALAKVKADNEARFKEADRLVQQMLANDRDNAPRGRPVEKAFALVFDVKKSPTKYGRSAAKEHFAECFTLFKNDPEALKRVSPAAVEWFAANKHLELAGKALEP